LAESFPDAVWGDIQASFFPSGWEPPASGPLYAALLFAFAGERCALADIAGRGWCIPGGRLEPDETPEAAARREAHEEAGLTVGPLFLLGHYRLISSEDGSIRYAVVYGATIQSQAALPPGTESRGVRLATMEELPHLYYLWDPLLAAVCRYAFARRPVAAC
jgi:8-oxo-dGTP diphosphatase